MVPHISLNSTFMPPYFYITCVFFIGAKALKVRPDRKYSGKIDYVVGDHPPTHLDIALEPLAANSMLMILI